MEGFLSYLPPPSLPTSLQNTFHIQSGVLQWSEMVMAGMGTGGGGGPWRAFSGTTQIIAEN